MFFPSKYQKRKGRGERRGERIIWIKLEEDGVKKRKKKREREREVCAIKSELLRQTVEINITPESINTQLYFADFQITVSNLLLVHHMTDQ